MAPPSSRMTRNQERNIRYRPGKAAAEEPETEEESSEEEKPTQTQQAPAPKVCTFPSQKKLAVDIRRTAQQGYAKPPPKQQDDDAEGFVTASESSEEETGFSSDGFDEASSEEESSSDNEPKKPILAPKFISKSKRNQQNATAEASSVDAAAEAEKRRKEKADEFLQAQLERDVAARAAGRKAWDDDDIVEDEVDDTDGADPEAELASWKLRELKRIRRDRLAIEENEKQREEIARRRNMTTEEREAEDKLYIDAQKEEREGKGKMSFMQKYHHKGAFSHANEEQDEEVKAALNRDLAGARYADDVSKDVLPDYMKIRDMSKLGKKGRTKYKDLKNEDTGRWADYGRKRRDYDGVDDERFRPDDGRDGGLERTGANTAPIGERRRIEDDGNSQREDKRARYG